MALTPAEKQKAYRERQKSKLDQPKSVRFSAIGSLVDELDEIAKALDMNRSKVVQDILLACLKMVLPTIKEGIEELQERINKAPEITPEEAKRVKNEYWLVSLGAMTN